MSKWQIRDRLVQIGMWHRLYDSFEEVYLINYLKGRVHGLLSVRRELSFNERKLIEFVKTKLT